MRILDVGSGPVNPMKLHFPDAEVVRLDVDPSTNPDVVLDITSDEFQQWKTEGFDLIWMSHVLEHLTLDQAKRVLTKLGKLLAVGGQLAIKVPSLEWSAEQILWETHSPVVPFHIFGGQSNEWQIHKWGYTLPTLRAMVATHANVAIREANRAVFQIEYDHKFYDAEELVVIGVRLE